MRGMHEECVRYFMGHVAALAHKRVAMIVNDAPSGAIENRYGRECRAMRTGKDSDVVGQSRIQRQKGVQPKNRDVQILGQGEWADGGMDRETKLGPNLEREVVGFRLESPPEAHLLSL